MSASKATAPFQSDSLLGPYTDINELIKLRFAAQDLKLGYKSKALSLLSGPNKTNFRGRGIDFEEVRAYQAGDDIRTIDWRITARTSKPYTKLFREERERPVMIFLDQRQNMFFGSQRRFKSVQAAAIASLLGWAALKNNDRVGGLVFNDFDHRESRPKRSRHAMLQWLRDAHHFNNKLSNPPANQSSADYLSEALTDLRRICKPGSAIYLISDFHGWNKTANKHLYQLARHNEITAFMVYDKLEQELPPPGRYAITNGSSSQHIQTGNSKARDQFRLAFAQRKTVLKEQLARVGIPLIPVMTAESPVMLLQTYYRSSKNRGLA
jgi:uncharacterized protein (DUF58 family)